MAVLPPLPTSIDRARLELMVTSDGQEARITGRLDVRSVADIRLALHRALAEGRGDLRLDLDEAELGDRAALGLLVECHVRARRLGRRLVLGELSPRTERLLRAARLIAATRSGASTPASGRGSATAGDAAYRAAHDARLDRDGRHVLPAEDETVAALTG